MQCREGCGACCIAPSITSPIPGMPQGKPADTRCVNLSDDNLCMLFGRPERPTLCASFVAQREFCGDSASEALQKLTLLERATR